MKRRLNYEAGWLQPRLGEPRKGATCLEAVYGVAFNFKNNQFVSEELEELSETLEARVENLQSQREQDYVKALVTACFEEYEIDKFRALTTPVCAEVFKTLGLPGTQ